MSNMIERVPDLRQRVYDALKARITEGEFPPDARFHEIGLAEELGVSRTPVREALAMLARDGLLEQGRRGFHFPRMTPEDIRNITEVRLQLEPFAIRRLVETTGPVGRDALARGIRAEVMRHRDSTAYQAAHRRIRAALLEDVANPVLVATIRQFEDSIHMMRLSTLKDQRWREKSAEGHLRLAACIARGDAEGAAAEQADLLIHARDSFLAFLAEQEPPAGR
ncbi:MAG: GntR family transcriptional regulator [Spirochaetaceae bacterium]|nr:GntR family transcriptional regulator [Spirochaetaceae bacterium]